MATDVSLTLESLAQRVANLEREMAALRQQSADNEKKGGIFSIIGSLADDPEFDEVLRLRREYRKSLDAESEE